MANGIVSSKPRKFIGKQAGAWAKRNGGATTPPAKPTRAQRSAQDAIQIKVRQQAENMPEGLKRGGRRVIDEDEE